MDSTDEKKIALVTGASRGIGVEIAAALVNDGFYVVGTATSASGADAISERLADNGAGMVLRVDDPASIEAAVKQLQQDHGHPAVVVHNAGVTRDNLMLRMSDDEWTSVIDTNLTSVYRLTKPLLRAMMKSRWGRVINVSSVVAQMGNPGQSNYVASKAGMEGFTRSLAAELGSRNITVNAVAPGFVDTDMTDALTDDQRSAMLERVALGRMAAPAEVAAVVSFLASDSAGYITGETIAVNGGLYMS
ncbi:MAG: 3-oxoacyl-ACP reductase FabG [Pseudomonadaceae bacterium]|nr:3-oxoacyl-ACP reductase FabG [Pseudomonadaceae bacterium]